MKIISVIFGLALLTVAFGVYSDHALTQGHIFAPESSGLAAAAALQHK